MDISATNAPAHNNCDYKPPHHTLPHPREHYECLLIIMYCQGHVESRKLLIFTLKKSFLTVDSIIDD